MSPSTSCTHSLSSLPSPLPPSFFSQLFLPAIPLSSHSGLSLHSISPLISLFLLSFQTLNSLSLFLKNSPPPLNPIFLSSLYLCPSHFLLYISSALPLISSNLPLLCHSPSSSLHLLLLNSPRLSPSPFLTLFSSDRQSSPSLFPTPTLTLSHLPL